MKNIPSALLYYLVILPVSKLPYSVLYLLSDVLFFVFYYLLGYRMKVIAGNIDRSFPDKSRAEKKKIVRDFYRHFCDLIVESLKVFSITEQQVKERFIVRNPEVFNRFYEEGRSVILAGGHFNNWELFAVAIDQPLKHQAVAVYKPLTNTYFDRLMRVSRGKYGLKMIPTFNVKKEFEKSSDEPSVFILATDQSPGRKTKAYWMTFLNQGTAVLFGTEKYAKEYNYPVVYGCINKLSRGHYDVTFELVHDQPSQTAYGFITEAHTRLLERDILRQPEYWLWSHRRWKHKRPLEEEQSIS
jgi:KDO2-lipid IV(A) lauroyltransferase